MFFLSEHHRRNNNSSKSWSPCVRFILVVLTVFVPRTCRCVMYNFNFRKGRGRGKIGTPSRTRTSAAAAVSAAEAGASAAAQPQPPPPTQKHQMRKAQANIYLCSSPVRILHSSKYFGFILDDEKNAPPVTFDIAITDHTPNRASHQTYDMYRKPIAFPHQ